MPWKIADVDRHFKGLTDRQKEVWVGVANGVLDSCLKAGGNQADCEARAIRVANDRAKGIKESRMFRPTKFTILTESVFGPGKVDREKRVIHDVVILTKESLDATGRVRRTYSNDCLNKAVQVFEGAPAFLDHPGSEIAKDGRSVRDQFGFYQGLQRVGDKVIAQDLVLYSTPDANLVLDIAEKNPGSAGNSIHAAGRVRTQNDQEIVEEILGRTSWGHRSSVDLVLNPATTRGIFESQQEGVTDMEMKDLTLEMLKESRKDLYEGIAAIVSAAKDAENATLKEQLAQAQKKIDDFTVQQTIAAKETLIDRVISESNLPAEAVTPTFREVLRNVQERKEGDKTISAEEGIRALVEDRVSLLKASAGGVKGNNSNPNNGGGKEKTLKECSTILRRG